MAPKTIQLYSSIECPFSYLALFRLMQILPEYEGRIQIFWRSLSLEYINQASIPEPLYQAQCELLSQIEPDLPLNPWPHTEWLRPTTFWPAFEAVACAQAQGFQATLAYDWALSQAYFVDCRNISLRHELLAIAEQIAATGLIYYPRFQIEFDSGRWKGTIVKENWRGWHELALKGSPTFITPDGQQFNNPGVGEVDFDNNTGELRTFSPYPGDPMEVYREMFAVALGENQKA